MDRFEIHSHSYYSNIRLIDSINEPKQLILRARDIGLKGICLTDHEALCGHIKWLKAEKELKESGELPANFKCGLGNEIYLVDKRTPKEKQSYYHCILIALDDTGHKQLRELSSKAWLNSYRYRGMERVPTLKKELEAVVRADPGHLILSSACLASELARMTMQLIAAEEENNTEEAFTIKRKIYEFLSWEIVLFGDNCYIEIAPGTSEEQLKYNSRIKSIASYLHRKIVIGTDAHFLSSEDQAVHRAFLNSKQGDRDVDSFYKDAWLMDEETIRKNLSSCYTPWEIDQIFKNSIEIYDKIGTYNLFHEPIIPVVQVKDYEKVEHPELIEYPVLKGLFTSNDIQERYWANQCLEKLNEKNLVNKDYLSRLETEADVIQTIAQKLHNELFAYFNTLQHYIDLFWDCGSVISAGRGSSCAFLSNYLLGITQIDPVIWDLPWFRFLNKERIELPDVDLDLCPSKRRAIFREMRKERGELNVVQVPTFGFGPKSAIQAAARGYCTDQYPNGIDVDTARFIASLVPVERGFVRSVQDCYYGNDEKGYKPIKAFVEEIDRYPGLLEIILKTENVVTHRGIHASGVILYNQRPFETAALMRAPNGDITIQYDLEDAEECGDVKYDFLLTKQVEKLSVAIDLLQKDGYIDSELTKRQVYDKYFHPDVINVHDERIWELLKEGNILDLFQFNTQIGRETIKAIQPQTPIEMAAANALIRLAAPEGQERPFNRYVRFKNNIELWYEEMDKFGLSVQEQKLLEPYYLVDYGVPSSQEALMRMTMDKNISNFSLAEANNARRTIAKKKVRDIPALKEKFFAQCPSKILAAYAWRTMMEPQASYAFSIIHALAYSYVAIQSLVLINQFPEIYWNCACLIVNSQSIEEEEATEDEVVDEDKTEDEDNEDEDDEGNEDEDKVAKPKVKINKSPNYGRIATAINDMRAQGIEIVPPNINKSGFTFSPDADANLIRYGLSGLAKVGEDIVNQILMNRPYTSIDDFLSKIKLNKAQIINLIKSGAFDDFGDRKALMYDYIASISGAKKKITLQNVAKLIEFKMLPEEFDFHSKVFNFNKYLKKSKAAEFYNLDNTAYAFYEKNFDIDLLTIDLDAESGFKIDQAKWDKIYKSYMAEIKIYITKEQDHLLKTMNDKLMSDVWNKYCKGTLSTWEMDSILYYYHEHELQNVDYEKNGFSNFFTLPEEPEIDKYFTVRGKNIPLLKIHRIIGTVLDKNKIKNSVTILTPDGVVTVKIYGDAFTKYDKRISEVLPSGKKHYIENSMFERGNKIVVTGVRRGDSFLAKRYKNTGCHLIEKIIDINEEGKIKTYVREDKD